MTMIDFDKPMRVVQSHPTKVCLSEKQGKLIYIDDRLHVVTYTGDTYRLESVAAVIENVPAIRLRYQAQYDDGTCSQWYFSEDKPNSYCCVVTITAWLIEETGEDGVPTYRLERVG